MRGFLLGFISYISQKFTSFLLFLKNLIKILLIQSIICIFELILFGNTIINYWVFGFFAFFIGLVSFFLFSKKTSTSQFHKYFFHIILNWWAISVCVLVNCAFFGKVFIGDFTDIASCYSPYALTSVILLDIYSSTYIVLTISIAMYIIPYVFKYMHNEVETKRFYILLGMFVGSMVLLLSADNLWLVFLGWELIGVFSYFLISFYIPSNTVVKAANKALFFNKISDGAFFLFFLITTGLLTDSSSDIKHLWPYLCNLYTSNSGHQYLIFLGLCSLSICAFCKSAQFGFYFWLPDSMEAPIPASSLIHSATLVSAGIYLIGRFNIMFEHYPFILNMISSVGLITAALGGVIACYQTDLKKILAYSTISHCGVLIFLATLNNPSLLFLYLIAHGFFKSLSFMECGYIITSVGGVQDVRKMGNLSIKHVRSWSVLVFSLSGLSSLPFSIGFFNKAFFLETGIFANPVLYYLSCFCLYLTGLCSIIYFARIIYYTFFSKNTQFQKYQLKSEVISIFKNFSYTNIKPQHTPLTLSWLYFTFLYIFISLMVIILITFFLYISYYLHTFSVHILPTNVVLTDVLSNFDIIYSKRYLFGPLFICVYILVLSFTFNMVTHSKYTIIFFYSLLTIILLVFFIIFL